MGLRPGLKVLRKRKNKSLAFVPGFELLDHPAHCLFCIVIILFVIHNISYSLSMNGKYYVSHYYRAGGYVVLTWIMLFKKKCGWPAVVCFCAKGIMRILEFT
jgi:hypothetical protein